MEDRRTAGGIGFLGMLTILFIGLKLGGVINWSWWWVLSPMWLPIAIALVFAAIYIGLDIIFGNKGKRYIRISLCAKDDKMQEALKRIKNEFKK